MFSSRSNGRSPSKCRVPRSPRRAATCVDRAGKEPTGFRYPREPLLVSPTVAQAHPWLFDPPRQADGEVRENLRRPRPSRLVCVCKCARARAPSHRHTRTRGNAAYTHGCLHLARPRPAALFSFVWQTFASGVHPRSIASPGFRLFFWPLICLVFFSRFALCQSASPSRERLAVRFATASVCSLFLTSFFFSLLFLCFHMTSQVGAFADSATFAVTVYFWRLRSPGRSESRGFDKSGTPV